MEGIAKTTSLIIEYLVGGILVFLAIGFLILSLFPKLGQWILIHLNDLQSVPGKDTLFAAIFIAVAYGIGVISEFLGQIIFQGRLDRIKKQHLREFVKYNQTILRGDDLLGDYVVLLDDEEKFEYKVENEAPSCIGQMRFYVLMKNPLLYGEIDSQIGRARLVRVLFIVEITLLATILGFLYHSYSWLLIIPLVICISLCLTTIKALNSRFERYCRAVERSYKAILIDQKSKATGAKAGA